MNRLLLWLGGAGAGIVWGWSLASLLEGSRRGRSGLTGRRPAVAVVSVAFGAEVALVAGARTAVVGSAAAAVGALVHQRWRRWLRRRFPEHLDEGQVR